MLRLQAAGSAGTQDVNQSTLVSYCNPGPLKDLFTNALAEPPPGSGVAAWADLLADARLSVYISPGSLLVSAGAVGAEFVAGTPNLLRLTIDSGSAVVELRYNPTAVR